MIVDIGGGTTEVAIMSLADIAVCKSIRVAGDELDEAIVAHMRKNYNLMIGLQTAEAIKIDIGSVAEGSEETTREVRGRGPDRRVCRVSASSPVRRFARLCASP